METNTDVLRKYTRLLKQKYENPDFKKDFDGLMSYYYEKIKQCSVGLDEEKDQWILERLDKAFNLQFLHGYMIFDELYNSNIHLFGKPENTSYDVVFESLPPVIIDLFKGYEKEIANVQVVNNFAIEVLMEKSDMILNDMLQYTFTEFLHYGICYAFIDKYEEGLVRTAWIKLQDWQGISFLTPQVFMVPSGDGLSKELLMFDLFGWSGSPQLNNEWVGRLTLNPYDTTSENQYVSLLLSDKLAGFDKTLITNVLNTIIMGTLKVANNEKRIMLDVFNISSSNAYITEMSVAKN